MQPMSELTKANNGKSWVNLVCHGSRCSSSAEQPKKITSLHPLDGNSFCLQMWRCRFCWWNSHWKKNKQLHSKKNYSPDMNNIYICNHKIYMKNKGPTGLEHWYKYDAKFPPYKMLQLWKVKNPLGTMQLQPETSRKPQHNIWTSLLSGLMLIKCSREKKNV